MGSMPAGLAKFMANKGGAAAEDAADGGVDDAQENSKGEKVNPFAKGKKKHKNKAELEAIARKAAIAAKAGK